jgi:hypothetical protein
VSISNSNLLELLGKNVSFSWLGADGVVYQTDGELSSIVFNVHGAHEFSVDDGDYFSELIDFKVLD